MYALVEFAGQPNETKIAESEDRVALMELAESEYAGEMDELGVEIIPLSDAADQS